MSTSKDLFEGVVKEIQKSQIGPKDLSIWGGNIPEAEIGKFLEGWDNLPEMPYRIWEYVSDIVFEKVTLPNEPALLQRGRLFGEGGDLELRRHGREFLWRFVGPAKVHPPTGYDAQDYWESHAGVTFYQREATALLWGERKQDRWADDRVGSAFLTYPANDTWSRVQLHYRTYSRAGRIQFVWYIGLSGWKEDTNDH